MACRLSSAKPLSEPIWIEIQTFSFRKLHLKMSSFNSRPFCIGLNVLRALYASYASLYSFSMAVVDNGSKSYYLGFENNYYEIYF